MNTGPALLSFLIWMMLTGEVTSSNIIIGAAVSAMASLLPRYRFSAWQMIVFIVSFLAVLPKVIWEACLILLLPHNSEDTDVRKIDAAGDTWRMLCRTLLITLTPRTLVVGEEGDGKLKVHTIKRKDAA